MRHKRSRCPLRCFSPPRYHLLKKKKKKTNKIRKHIQLNLSWYTSTKGNNYTDVSDHIPNCELGSIHL